MNPQHWERQDTWGKPALSIVGIELKKINKKKFQAEKKREEKENIAFCTVRTVRYAQAVRSKEKTVSQQRQTKHCVWQPSRHKHVLCTIFSGLIMCIALKGYGCAC
jgi:hypothetical protein